MVGFSFVKSSEDDSRRGPSYQHLPKGCCFWTLQGISRWWFKHFHPYLGEIIQFDEHIFQMSGSTTSQIIDGWFLGTYPYLHHPWKATIFSFRIRVFFGTQPSKGFDDWWPVDSLEFHMFIATCSRWLVIFIWWWGCKGFPPQNIAQGFFLETIARRF